MSIGSFSKSLLTVLADRFPGLIDAYRFVVHPTWEVANRRDHRHTHRHLGWLRALPAEPATAPTALLVLRREDIFDIKSSLMLGSAMRLRGVRPVVLANHPRVPRILRYMRAFGVSDVRYRSQLVAPPEARREMDQARRDLLRGDLTFADVRPWRYRGHPAGERVLSTLIRETLDPEPDLSLADNLRRLRRIVDQVLTNYHSAEAILDAVTPRWLLAHEIGYAVNGPLVDVALERGVHVLVVSPYLREGSLMCKRTTSPVNRAGPVSVSADTLERLEHEPWSEVSDAEVQADLEGRYGGASTLQRMYQWDTRAGSREEICADLGLDPDKPLAVVFSHVLWDASFFYGRDLFVNYRQWLEQTVLAAVANPRAQWLIKTHPSNAFRLAHGDISGPVAEVELVRRLVDPLPDHVRLVLPKTHISALALYRHADVGVTVRGTPGLEMACFGKPVLTAGTGHYSGLGFTVDSASAGEYLDRLGRIETLLEPPGERHTERARRYAHTLFRLRPWTARSFAVKIDFPERGWHPLDRNVLPVATSLAEAERLGDLHRWADWAVGSDEADYLSVRPPAEPVTPAAEGATADAREALQKTVP